MLTRKSRFAVFFLAEGLLFALFYLNLYFTDSTLPFYLYVGLSPVFFFILTYISDVTRKKAMELLLSKDMVIFIGVISAWVYIYALAKLPIPYVFSTLYFPVLIEEVNFRFIITNYLTEIMNLPRAVVIQAFLYTFLYASYIIVLPGSYPGLYAPFFIIDMLSVGLIYGGIYYFRKNLYIDISVHLSLWLMAAVIPYLLVWIPYTFAPT